MLRLLIERGHPLDRLTALGSARRGRTTLAVAGVDVPVVPACSEELSGADVVLLAVPAEEAPHWATVGLAAGARVVDSSSAFRSDPDVPLVVPEVNDDEVPLDPLVPGLLASPNCSTILLTVVLSPLRSRFGIERVVVSTYQAVSGAGAAAMDELTTQASAVLAGEPALPRVFPEPCAFNVFSHESAVDEVTGLNGEERKMIDEVRRLWRDSSVEVVPTCIRVPVLRSHSESVLVRWKEPATMAEVREVLSEAPGVRLIDDRASGRFPTPRGATERDEIDVGRVRAAVVDGEPTGPQHEHCLWLCGDQLRKGAALNALQVAGLVAAREVTVA